MPVTPKNKIAIFGCGGHARSVADVILDSGDEIECFFDKMSQDEEKIFNIPCLKSDDIISSTEVWHVALGDAEQRRIAAQQLISLGKQVVSVCSERAYLGKEAFLGQGVFIAHGAHIGPLSSIGDLTIINTGAVVEHEVVIGRCCHVSINSVVAGRAKIGDNVFVGAGAVIRDGVSVCGNVTLGAGAVVAKDILEPGIYVGIPCVRSGEASPA